VGKTPYYYFNMSRVLFLGFFLLSPCWAGPWYETVCDLEKEKTLKVITELESFRSGECESKQGKAHDLLKTAICAFERKEIETLRQKYEHYLMFNCSSAESFRQAFFSEDFDQKYMAIKISGGDYFHIGKRMSSGQKVLAYQSVRVLKKYYCSLEKKLIRYLCERPEAELFNLFQAWLSTDPSLGGPEVPSS
jgi:hypothetical protein